MTGSNSSLKLKPSDMLLVPGSSFHQKTKMVERNTALANSGTEVVMMLVTEMVRSSFEPSFIPARMPRIREMGIITAKTQKPRIAVFHNRGKSISTTGVLKRMDSPKSPVTKLPNQRR